MAGRRKKNCVTPYAVEAGRDYITSEDVTKALLAGNDLNIVRYDVLAVLGKTTEFGWEDPSLCAFIAWEGSRAKDRLPDIELPVRCVNHMECESTIVVVNLTESETIRDILKAIGWKYRYPDVICPNCQEKYPMRYGGPWYHS
jgi:hypothetical protein